MSTVIREMDPAELPVFFRRIEEDFPEEEHAPFHVLDEHLRSGIQEGLVLSDGGKDIAYAINAVSPCGYVLISLMAVSKELRGEGIGSAFIGMMKERYAGKKGIILEVERPDKAGCGRELFTMKKRISFYERLGFHLVPGIDYWIWNVRMHLMAMPLTESASRIDAEIETIIKDIYRDILGERWISKLDIRRAH